MHKFSMIQEKKLVPLLFAISFLSALFFFATGNWAQTSHDDLTWAIVEQGTFRIDSFLTNPKENSNTGDWAAYPSASESNSPHYYSNKAPGGSFLGAVVYAPVYYGERLFGCREMTLSLAVMHTWWVNLWCSVLPLALCSVMMYLVLRQLKCSPVRSAVFAEITALCTPLWPYSTANWAHPLAAMCLTIALYSILKTESAGKKNNFLLLAGCMTGYSFLTDYGCASAVLVFSLFAVWKAGKQCVFFFLGAILPGLLFAWYHISCFGSPFVLASFYNNPQFIDSEKTFGIFSLPSSFLMVKLLFGAERGVFWGSPVLLLGVPGLMTFWKEGKKQREFVCFLAAWILLALTSNASFNGWHAGLTISARYLIFTLPAFGIAAAKCPLHVPWQRICFAGLALLSWGNMFVISAVTPFAADGLNPLYRKGYFYLLQNSIVLEYRGYCHHFHLTDYPKDMFFARGFWSLHRVFHCSVLWEFLTLALLTGLSVYGIARLCQFPIKTYFHVSQPRLPWGKQGRFFHFLTAVCVLALCLLFCSSANIIWSNDEPMLLRTAWDACLNMHWCRRGIMGSFGVFYGPIPLWIYQILFMFTASLPTIAFLKTCVLGGLLLALLWQIGKEIHIPTRFFYAFAFLSPWIWNYTRSLWDNVFLMPLSLAAILCVLKYVRQRKTYLLASAAILVLAAIWTHSMAAPLAGGIAVFFLWQKNILKRNWKSFLVVGIPSAIISIAILLMRFFGKTEIRANDFWDESFSLGERLSGIIGYAKLLSPIGFLNYYAPQTNDFILPVPVLTALSYPVLMFCLVCTGYAVADAIRRKNAMRNTMEMLSISILTVHTLFLLLTGVQIYPHYHIAVSMPFLLLVVSGFHAACSVKAMKYAFVLSCVCSTLFLGTFFLRLAETKSISSCEHFGVTLSRQWSFARHLNQLLADGYTVSFQLQDDSFPYESYPWSLEVLRELEDAEHPKSYSDPNGTPPIPIVLKEGQILLAPSQNNHTPQ